MTGKRQTYLSLLIFLACILGITSWLLWRLAREGPEVFVRGALIALFVVFLGLFAWLTLGLAGVHWMRYTGHTPVLFRPMSATVLRHLLPLVSAFSSGLKVSPEEVQRSFVELNNQLVRASMAGRLDPSQILVLAPHCLQWHECPYRVTREVTNCRRCGNCDISGLLELRSKYGVEIGVATGGSAARELVMRLRPKAIVAVACERDLSSGIQDIQPLPSIGVFNVRPHGPCFDTAVDLNAVEHAIRYFLEPGVEKGLEGSPAIARLKEPQARGDHGDG